ncbi:hypothetical protein GCM10010112_90330 [Actinoplanes lobatus]|uniref:Uncharacterized protein n=1 Tax=Actinoplanes lobatus TaxID=113568 RepID=A0A7W7HKZ9_9ACTN|nr:hypothetical protein [Actinoplanes lobatus]MBB4752439.1 hypothetical protein [Actinoplanes lobatus]GGN97718.1 hypothetical protein GCM10010112_90330 [Actinoplanes lobatus]GIE45791.1 hypothetical protein Alo02nite_86890 [Actinoplanes lobatus]
MTADDGRESMSISLSIREFLVAVAASLGFLAGLGSENISLVWVLRLLLGGVIAAPIAPWLVRPIPPRVAGTTVGGLIILTNARSLLRSDWIDASDGVRYGFHLAIAVVWPAALTYTVREYRLHRDEDRSAVAEAEDRAAAVAS